MTGGAPEPSAAADREAAGQLLQLQQRLAAASPPRDALSTALRRRARRERAVQRLGRELQASAASPPPPAAVPVAPVDPVGDAREDEAWFRALPPHEQQRLRTVWGRQEQQLQGFTQQLRQDRRLRFATAAVVFAGISVPQIGMLGRDAAMLTAAAGMVAGLLWCWRPLGRFWCSGTAVFAYFAAHGLGLLCHGGGDLRMLPMHTMFAAAICWLSAMVAVDAEMRQTGGFGST